MKVDDGDISWSGMITQIKKIKKQNKIKKQIK
jgi:hypothetical protein